MKKTLIIIVHPNLKESVLNKRWIIELQKYSEQYDIHNLYEVYPNEKIDIAKEQKLIESYDKIIFQFPFYWFSSPPLLKKWFNEVFTYGWAYGSTSGYKLENKKIALAISVGINKNEYSYNGKYKYTLEELTRPFELTFEYLKADYQSFYAYYGIELNSTKEWIENSISGYLNFIKSI